VWSIANATGWTLEYLMWSVSWINLQMMIADAPGYSDKPKEVNSEDELKEFFKV